MAGLAGKIRDCEIYVVELKMIISCYYAKCNIDPDKVDVKHTLTNTREII